MLEIKSLSKSYKGKKGVVRVIDNLSFKVGKKDFIVLFGPSGCGKTTILKSIAGLVEPTSGEIKLDGKKICGADKKVGMVFQNFSLFPWLTIRENISFGLKIQGRTQKKIDEIVNHYLELTDLVDFADSYPRDLSGGMKQRVAIARALANDPDILLMDEPFGSLDHLTRSKMQKFLLDLWEKEDKTIIFVTHDVEEALFLADKIYVLSKRPTTIFKEIKVPFERTQRNIKESWLFFKLKNDVLKTMKGESF